MIEVFVIIEDIQNDDFDRTTTSNNMGYVTSREEAVKVVAELTSELQKGVHPGYPPITDDWRGSEEEWELMHDNLYGQHMVSGYSFEELISYKPS